VQNTELMSPSTKSVLSIGEESLAKSIGRLGQVDFFSVVTRKPRICDFKPVVVEVALARFLDRGREDEPVQVLRFANRVPLQFDKSACAITKAIESVNWRSYGLNQPKDSVPLGPYVFAVSVVSPFIKFKNASKETIDASDELVEELRRCLMQAGQKLSRHIRREAHAEDLERKIRHIEQFGPMLVEGLVRITKANNARKKNAEEGLRQILGRDAEAAEEKLEESETQLKKLKAKTGQVDVIDVEKVEESEAAEAPVEKEAAPAKAEKASTKKAAKKAEKKTANKKDQSKKKK
jgi:DNA topoisomerase-6 subunit B